MVHPVIHLWNQESFPWNSELARYPALARSLAIVTNMGIVILTNMDIMILSSSPLS